MCLIVLPAGESTYHSAPNWSRFWPFVSPRLLVARVVVERVAVVGDLGRAVGALRRPDQGRGRAGAGHGRSVGRERRPGARAGAGAGALRARVLLEQVEGHALRVDQDLAEPGAPDVSVNAGSERRSSPAHHHGFDCAATMMLLLSIALGFLGVAAVVLASERGGGRGGRGAGDGRARRHHPGRRSGSRGRRAHRPASPSGRRRDPHPKRRPAATRAVELDLASERLHAVLEPDEPGALPRRGAAGPVVADRRPGRTRRGRRPRPTRPTRRSAWPRW